ncbi:MAG: hypothetical protein ABI693_08460 [Bryobacteraceae bacterium]
MDYNYRGGARSYRPVTVVNNHWNISAMNFGSFGDYAKRNSIVFVDAVSHAITGGNGEELIGMMRQIG